MPTYVRYDKNTGTIFSVGRCTPDIDPTVKIQDPANEGMILNAQADARVEYVDPATETIQPKTDMTLTVTGNKVSGIPAGTAARVGGVGDYIVDDGEIELSADAPGLYKIRLEHPRHHTQWVEINVS